MAASKDAGLPINRDGELGKQRLWQKREEEWLQEHNRPAWSLTNQDMQVLLVYPAELMKMI